jgi:putative effector of murein hydrolase
MKKKTSMDIIHPHAAGIDVGSRSHFVAIGQAKEDVKEFGVYNEIYLHSPSGCLIMMLHR